MCSESVLALRKFLWQKEVQSMGASFGPRKRGAWLPLLAALAVASAASTHSNDATLRADDGFRAADEIRSLPGWSQALPSKQYSGSIALADGSGIRYWLVVGEGDWERKPLVLWVQGGPGGSSLEGMWTENMGPFAVAADGALERSASGGWSTEATMLFWEMPAGVGFSTCAARGCPTYDDTKFEAQATEFFCEFFAAFPALAPLDFFMTGESYGGVYVPLAALGFVEAGCAAKVPKLVGAMVGNGCTGTAIGPCGPDRAANTFDQLADRAMVAPATAERVRGACPAGFLGADDACKRALRAASAEAGRYDTYDVMDGCAQNMTLVKFVCDETPNASWACAFGDGPAAPRLASGADCGVGARTAAYLSRADVQDAIHVPRVAGKPVVWGARDIHYTRTAADLLTPSRRSYPRLVEKLDRVLIYSGDADGQVPWRGTEAWTRGLGYATARPWRPWALSTGEVAGSVVAYERNFTFATVRNAGHMVPTYKPDAALALLRRFLRGHEL